MIRDLKVVGLNSN